MDRDEAQPARIILEFYEGQEFMHVVVQAEACFVEDNWIHFTTPDGAGESRPREQVVVVEWLSESPDRTAYDDPEADEAGAILRERDMPLSLTLLPGGRVADD